MEGYAVQLLIASLGALVWFLINRVTSKLDDIHGDLVTLTVNHGERITRLEEKAHFYSRKTDSAPFQEV